MDRLVSTILKVTDHFHRLFVDYAKPNLDLTSRIAQYK